jgi:hypothetical protein
LQAVSKNGECDAQIAEVGGTAGGGPGFAATAVSLQHSEGRSFYIFCIFSHNSAVKYSAFIDKNSKIPKIFS